MEGIIRVQVEHHKGGKLRGPQFQLNKKMVKPEISISEKVAEFKSGELSAIINRGDTWYVTFQAGEQVLTHNDWHALGYVDTPDGYFIHERLNLGVGE